MNWNKEYFRSLDEFYIVYDVDRETDGDVFVWVYDEVFDDFLSAKEFVAKKLDEKYIEARETFEKVELNSEYYYKHDTVDLPLKNNLFGKNSLFDYKIFVKKIRGLNKKEEDDYNE